MHTIKWTVVGFGLMVMAIGAASAAQDGPKRTQADEIRKILEDIATQDASRQLQEARKQLEKLLQEKQNREQAGKDKEKKDEGPPKIIFQKKVIEVNKGKSADGLEGKIDLLLKEVAELRKDVNQIKSRLDAKPTLPIPVLPFDPKKGDKKPGGPNFQILPFPGGGPGGIEIELEFDKLDKATLKEIEEMLKKAGLPGGILDVKKAKTKPAPVQPERSQELERRLERILEEAEALRRDIQKAKSGSK